MKADSSHFAPLPEVPEESMNGQSGLSPHARFLASMSHELRTPLNGIIGSINLLLQQETLPQQQEHIDTLKYCSQHMLSLINDVLDYGKIGAGQMQLSPAPFNLVSSIDKLQAAFARQYAERGIELSVIKDEALNKIIVSDEMRLTQVLTNLLSNALKFTRQGSVTFTIAAVSNLPTSVQVQFTIEDTGVGISNEHQQIIFDAFRQAESSTKRNFGGTGIGLTISKQLVTMLGGNLEVESELTKGSKFHFTLDLPFAPALRNTHQDEMTHSLTSLEGYKVLMADDSHINRQITRRFLQKWGVVMDEAQDGKEAVDAFYKNKYDLLLIDLHMPEMDGYETIEAIRKIDKDVPAFAFTAAVLPGLHEKLKNKGFTDLLQKPFKPEDLHQKLMDSKSHSYTKPCNQ